MGARSASITLVESEDGAVRRRGSIGEVDIARGPDDDGERGRRGAPYTTSGPHLTGLRSRSRGDQGM
jgi:hypothetical protein